MALAEQWTIAHELPDGSGKPGEVMCDGPCRTCSEQPEQMLIEMLKPKAQKKIIVKSAYSPFTIDN